MNQDGLCSSIYFDLLVFVLAMRYFPRKQKGITARNRPQAHGHLGSITRVSGQKDSDGAYYCTFAVLIHSSQNHWISTMTIRLLLLCPFFLLLMSIHCTTRAFVFRQPRSKSFECFRMMSTSKKTALEVEQKFALQNGGSHVEKRLKELGFSKKGEIDMVDWYFDTPEPDWTLTTRDCWLRCREAGQSSTWQLKRGRRHDGGATVYEELEDEEAVEATISLLSNTKLTDEVLSEYEGYPVPQLLRVTGLVPFARIETHRSSWTFPGESESYNDLTVDLDGTQYGHMVGEVEAVVYSDSEVSSAKGRIKSLIQEIVPEEDTSSQVPVGKLEHYLIRHRPEHYKACVEGGSIQER